MRHTPWHMTLGARLLAAAGLLTPFAAQAAALQFDADLPATTAAQSAEAASWRFHADHVLGTSLDLVAVAGDEATAQEALAVVRAEIDRLDLVLSSYRPDSELSALNSCSEMQVSQDLYNVVAACEQWRTVTAGAFSGRLGHALQQWQDAAQAGELDLAALQQSVAKAAAATVTLDPASRTIRRPEEVRFAMDALAKGYIIDRAIIAARKQVAGLDGLMLDIGGDMRSWGKAPQTGGWQVGVAHTARLADNGPVAAVLQLNNQAVATSGRGMRDLQVGDNLYGHTLDPQTGSAASLISSATVIAPQAADADALATALSVLSPAQGLAMIAKLPGVEALLQLADGRQFSSGGWHSVAAQREARAPSLIHTADAAGTPWPAGFSTNIEYEIPKIDSDNYKAPFVAIWITDQNRNIVRNLTHLGNQEKWIDSNYVWWRRYGRKIEKLDAVTKPTRKPGKYAIAWDGSDEEGKKVTQGKYLVHIEASREHGGHTYQTFELELAAKPFSQPVPAKEELGAVTLRYGKAI
ncbi:DUF2271 domain-containing protein [Chitinimonas naiadis]